MDRTRTISIDSKEVKHLCRRDKRLCRLIHKIGNLDYRLRDDPYKYLVETIIGQLISVKAAEAIIERLKNACGGEITLRAVSGLSETDIKAAGCSLPKAKYIKGITRAAASGELDFEKINSMDFDSAMKELKKIKGIGDWTAKMYALSFLDSPDILPVCDVAFMRACKWFFKDENIKPKDVEKLAESWRPYSSTATRYLYHCLQTDFKDLTV